MKTIIVATDFSPVSLNAAAYAVKMAETLGANMLLFNVYEFLPNYTEMVFDVDVDDLKKSADSQLLKFKADLLDQTNAQFIINTEARMGVFEDELISICERLNPYAVIMGSQGKTTAENILMGSHAGKTIDHFTWPVITVPPTVTFSAIKKIAIAYDFEKEIDANLIADIKLLTQDFKASIDILNTAQEDEFNENFIFLSRMLEKSFKPFLIKYHFLTSNQLEDGILKYVDSNNIDLLIVMPKLHNFFQKLFHKSHSKQLVLHCHVPVMSLSK